MLCLLVLAGCHGRVPPPAEAPPAVFDDRTPGSGLEFTYRNGEEAGHLAIIETLGGGVALIDYDGDGLLDVFLTGGGYFDHNDAEFQKDKSKIPGIHGHPWKLFKNLGNFRFRDVTHEVGLDQLAENGQFFYSHGAAVCDYDRDGWPDLLVTGWHGLALLHNEPDGNGNRRFVDVTRKAGLPDGLWTTSAAWADLDGDGWPDLYVCQYVNWSFEKNHPTDCNYGWGRDVCPPKTFNALPHRLFRNNGNGTFTDVSKEAGLRNDGKGLGVLIVDLNGDGKPDIYVGNDTTDNFLYLNRSSGPGKGDRTSKITGPVPCSGPPGRIVVEEKAMACRVAVTDLGQATGSMGLDAAAYDDSDRPSLLVTTFEDELHSLFRNEGKERFLYTTPTSGLGALGRSNVGFGVGFLDFDNDGWEDIAIANGHIFQGHPAGRKQSPALLRNDRKKRFIIATEQGGSYFQSKHIARGLTVGDLDNDGRADLVISSINEPVAVLRNVCDNGNHWLGVELVGRNYRDIVGARVALEVAGRKLTRFAKGGGSYLSSGDRRLLFGLGPSEKVGRLTVAWPWGETQHFDGLTADRYWRLLEGESKP
jgi:hypothetical protein